MISRVVMTAMLLPSGETLFDHSATVVEEMAGTEN